MNQARRQLNHTFITRCQYGLWALIGISALSLLRAPLSSAIAAYRQSGDSGAAGSVVETAETPPANVTAIPTESVANNDDVAEVEGAPRNVPAQTPSLASSVPRRIYATQSEGPTPSETPTTDAESNESSAAAVNPETPNNWVQLNSPTTDEIVRGEPEQHVVPLEEPIPESYTEEVATHADETTELPDESPQVGQTETESLSAPTEDVTLDDEIGPVELEASEVPRNPEVEAEATEPLAVEVPRNIPTTVPTRHTDATVPSGLNEPNESPAAETLEIAVATNEVETPQADESSRLPQSELAAEDVTLESPTPTPTEPTTIEPTPTTEPTTTTEPVTDGPDAPAAIAVSPTTTSGDPLNNSTTTTPVGAHVPAVTPPQQVAAEPTTLASPTELVIENPTVYQTTLSFLLDEVVLSLSPGQTYRVELPVGQTVNVRYHRGIPGHEDEKAIHAGRYRFDVRRDVGWDLSERAAKAKD